MPDPNFIYQNSRFFENLLEHRFLFDLRRHLVLDSTPRLVNVLKSEVDAYGFDLVLSVAARVGWVEPAKPINPDRATMGFAALYPSYG
ncbi:MAG: hypothetical protein B7Y41_07050 [Hydrogenophilales bacterium 28-61-23]|nr:MAG: hypothetical protein B7Y41_07050 [Hydrogenophilales bacterium 28-61-23]